MYESSLQEMSGDELFETLSSLRSAWRRRPWRVEEAALVEEIRQELRFRGLVDRSVDDVLEVLGNRSSEKGGGTATTR